MSNTDFDSLARRAMRSLLDGQPPNGTQPADCGRWADEVEALYDAYERGGVAGVKDAFNALSQANRALAELIAGDPEPIPREYPLLPGSIVLPGVDGNTWLETYKGYAGSVSPMTPDLFHEGAALFLAAVAIARRLKVPMAFGDVYPNLYLLLLAMTTLYRKTTALNIARGLIGRILPHLLAAQDTTVEALLSDLAGRQPADFSRMSEVEREHWHKGLDFAAQRGVVLDEMSGLLSSAGKDYNQGLIEMLMRLYDCESQYTRSTRGQGRVTVYNAYLSLLGASTPGVMATHLAAHRLWAMGWWPRFAILTPEADCPPWKNAQAIEEPSMIADALQRLHERLPSAKWPDPPGALTVSMSDDAMKLWDDYNKAVSYDLLVTYPIDERLKGTYGRLPTQALKVATILAALDWPEDQGAPHVELPHLAQAIAICERWRSSAHRALKMGAKGQSNGLKQRVLQLVIRNEPKGITRAELKKAISSVNPERIDAAVDQMLGVELREVDARPGRQGGRPTKRLRLV